MKQVMLLLILGFALFGSASADEILFPAPLVQRSGVIQVVYRLDRPATGTGVLAVEWTDVYRRVIEQLDLPFTLNQETDVVIPLDMTRAVATSNRLRTHLSFQGRGEDGAVDDRATETEASFTTAPPDRGWPDYQIVMWQRQRAEQYAVLRDLGISAGVAYATADVRIFEQMIGPLLQTDLRWYVENIATDFYSSYHRWTPDRPKNWRFLAARKLYKENPFDIRALVRDPSLSDQNWLQKIRNRLISTVHAYAPYRPLFYNLADEPGIAETAAFWDFDLSAPSLSGMRDWLRQQYGSLTALNRQWGTNFTAWEQVMPMITREAVTRPDDNFSAWADFKAWMDVAFARAVRAGTDAVHAADPAARAAIEGAQVPGWGGYDYSRLATAVDVMEIYDYGENVEIVRSLNPDLILLTTSGGSGPSEAHAVWRDLLHGSRGVILWDDDHEIVGRDGSVGRRGRDAASWIGKIRGGVGALLIGSRRHTDPIAMLYSPASLRTQWILDVRPTGQAWADRDVDSEYEDNPIRSSSRRFRWAIEHMGLQHRMISPEQIESGDLQRQGYRVLILPQAIALSPAEADKIRLFVAQGGAVIAAGEPGVFDQHSRRFPQPLLSDLFPATLVGSMQTSAFDKGKAIRLAAGAPDGQDISRLLASIFAAEGIEPQYRLARRDGEPLSDVETNVFRNGSVTIVALMRNPSVLPAASGGEEQAAVAERSAGEPIVLTLPSPSFLYDILARKPLGRIDRLEFVLDAVEPTILALAEDPLPGPVIIAPARLRVGETGTLRLSWQSASGAAFHVLHVDIADPTGKVVTQYSGNLIAAGETATHPLPLALNDVVGTWHIRVTDVLSGQATDSEVEVVAH